jgi:hypothetical protein
MSFQRPATPDDEPKYEELLTFTPAPTTLVFELLADSGGPRERVTGWLWCLVTPGEVGFKTVAATTVGGSKPIDMPDRAEFGAHLFTY